MKKLLLVLAALVIVGCANQRFELKASDASATLDDKQSFWVGGIGQSETVDAAKVCGGAAKVANVETQQTGGNVLLTIVTIGIYSPRQVRITCVK